MEQEQTKAGEGGKFFERRGPEAETAKVTELPARPQLTAQITITLYSDGNAQVNGPFEDRILFKGLLSIAADVEREMYGARRAQAEARAKMLASETRLQRWQRERSERQAVAKAQRAADEAASRSKDELNKVLAK